MVCLIVSLLNKMENIITDEKLGKYFSITGEALSMIKFTKDLSEEMLSHAKDFLDMATRYYSDAKHFRDKGDIVNSFAALNYAHGWLDAGARIKLFDVNDNKLFTVD